MSKVLSNWLSQSFLGRLRTRYKNYIEQILTSGYIPKPKPWLLWPSRKLFQFWRFLQLGRCNVVGAENLSTPGRVIFCPNHSSLFDAIAVHPSMTRPIRTMGAYESMKGLLGLKAIFLTGVGVFPVDRKNGSSVIKPAVDLLVSGEPLMIFPEGKIDNSGKLGEFKVGAAYIALSAEQQLQGKEPVGLVPMHICYGKRNKKTGDSFNFLKMAFSWRGGVTLHIGKPIWLSEHRGLSAEELMQVLRRKIISLCPRAYSC
ncbi:MAG: 1-acyl-sn-glycerol-3-phosphate acyltransferase [Candidatus Obscuribacterales bacterium]|nr:1-acyl-sn-glycerol-3-phosphate acyltransferase [Candidatus Obscuribacterales bacterium]